MTTGPFQTPAWRAAAVATGRYADASVVLPEDPSVLLPALRRRGVGGRVASLPLGWGFGGLVTREGAVLPAQVAAAVDALRRRGTRSLLLRPPPAQDEAFRASGVAWTRVAPNHSYDIGLDEGWDAVAAGMAGSVRRAVRKAERAGVEVERRTDREALRDFYRLYRLSVARWSAGSRAAPLLAARARLLEPFRKYVAVQDALGESCGIWVARHEETVVAAIIVLSGAGEHAYWRGAMDAGPAGPVRANDLLQVRAVEHACAEGARTYAMGLTEPGSGLARFKSGFGARERVSHEYALEPPWRGRLAATGQRLRASVR